LLGGRDCIIAYYLRQLIACVKMYGIISPLPSKRAGHILLRDRQQMSQSHTLPDRPVRATDL